MSDNDFEPVSHVEKTPFWKYLVAGTAGGVTITIVGHPLDTVKVRLQTQESGKRLFKGPVDCFLKTFRNEGVQGLYKGVWSPMFGSAALFALCFFSYGFGKKLVARTDDTTKMNGAQIFGAGLFGGFLPTAVMTPMERVKVLLQTQYGATGEAAGQAQVKRYNGIFDCARKVGLRGLYQGTMSTLYRDVVGSGFYYLGYEVFMKMMIPKGGNRSDVNTLGVLFAGGMAGLSCWSYMIFPDTVKSRIQAADPGTYRNFVHAFRSTIRSEGVGVFWRAAKPVFLRAFPANAACFLGYEYTMRGLNLFTDWRRKKDQRKPL